VAKIPTGYLPSATYGQIVSVKVDFLKPNEILVKFDDFNYVFTFSPA
jgi:hypothetical protein